MTDRKIELGYGHGFGWQQLLANSKEIFISHEKKNWLVAAWNLQSIKTLLTLELSHYCKSGSNIFLKRAGRCPQWLQQTQKHPVFVLARRPEQAEQESCPKSFAFDFAL